MNLVIDIGNTQTKLAVFSAGGEIVFKTTAKKPALTLLLSLIKKYEVDYSIVSTVITNNTSIIKLLKRHTYFLLFTNAVAVPLKNNYATPNTLGRDRLANAVGAAHLFSGKNCLIIDAGTCIKYDFVNNKNEYLGGAISPGVHMRYKALHAFTAKLPMVQRVKSARLLGNSTEESIRSGVQNGALAEIEQLIIEYKKQYKQLKTVVTGGDSGLFANKIKSHIFAAPDLTLTGLNRVLEFNK